MDGVIVDRVGSCGGNWPSGAIVVVGRSGRLMVELWVDGCRLSGEGCAVDVKALYQSGVVKGGAITDAGNCEADFVINSTAVGLKARRGNILNFAKLGDKFLSVIAELPAFPEGLCSLARK